MQQATPQVHDLLAQRLAEAELRAAGAEAQLYGLQARVAKIVSVLTTKQKEKLGLVVEA